jgi:Bacterial regulatory proteins, luxR family
MITGSESARLQIHEEVRKVSFPEEGVDDEPAVERPAVWPNTGKVVSETEECAPRGKRSVLGQSNAAGIARLRRNEPCPDTGLDHPATAPDRMHGRGMTNREIGQKLYLSHRTAGAHLRRILQKLLHSWATAPRTNPSEGRRKPVTHRCPDARAVM